MADDCHMPDLKIALAQLNPLVGDCAGNAEQLLSVWRAAETQHADIVVASELFLSGYPPEDLVTKAAFISEVRVCVTDIIAVLAAAPADAPALIFGLPWEEGEQLYNSVIAIEGTRVEYRHKVQLPNYGVFDEKRYFTPGILPAPITLRGVKFGVPICEDIWSPEVPQHLYAEGAQILLNINASPFAHDKPAQRWQHAHARVQETGLPLAYVNQVGGQDELVFDGASFIAHPDTPDAPIFEAIAFAKDVLYSDWRYQTEGYRCERVKVQNDDAHQERAPAPARLSDTYVHARLSDTYVRTRLSDTYSAILLGLRDYIHKNRFPHVLLGLSGGIDSALCAAFACDAIGATRVRCFMLPSIFTSDGSIEDATACAQALGAIVPDNIEITSIVEAIEEKLANLFDTMERDVTEENIQARIRGLVLMALSNKFGGMLITTGNKSELATGYATLYGDMNGGFNPIKDVYKSDVFALARWRNTHLPPGAMGNTGVVIPTSIIDKPPSAELRPEQTDQDSLPPYDVLDAILQALIEDDHSITTIVERGYDRALVSKIENLLYVAEYKRRQSAPGPKISTRYFGRDRRYPITHGFRSAAKKTP